MLYKNGLKVMENLWRKVLGTLNKKGLNDTKQFLKLCFRGLKFLTTACFRQECEGEFFSFLLC